MKSTSASRLAAAALLAAVAVAVSSNGASAAREPHYARGRIWDFTFQADTLGQAPPHTTVRGGDWVVLPDSSAPGERVLRQRMNDDGIAWHYIQFDRPVLDDVIVSVRFRIDSGEIDPSAGILFQLDPKGRSGYLVRLTGETHEIAFHYLLLGKRRDVRFVKIAWPEPGTWHTLAVRREGFRLTVLYDGKEAMQVRDERYRKGSVGLWTENDSVVDFADLAVGVP